MTHRREAENLLGFILMGILAIVLTVLQKLVTPFQRLWNKLRRKPAHQMPS